MLNPLTMKLEQFTRFDADERRRLDDLLAFPSLTYARGATILAEGSKVENIHLVVSGFAARSKSLADGTRQTMAFLIPGDLCDVEVFVLDAMDHDIVAIAETRCVLIPASKMEELLTESSNLTRAMWWSTMTDSAVLRERIIDHGSRDARQQIAHLFCEMLIRLRIVGETTDHSFPFPLTQEELGEATGMTPVHVNRVLQQLRAEGLIQFKDKAVQVLDSGRLMRLARFEADYLHLTRTEAKDPEVSGRVGDLFQPAPDAPLRAMPRARDRTGRS
jgi:CRP-like cAMP-binding protein